jgi:hypothetical protein
MIILRIQFLRVVFFIRKILSAIAMTIGGVIRKSVITLFLLLAGAAFAWTRSYATVEEIGGDVCR